jgi:phage terminase large subunit-like protein
VNSRRGKLIRAEPVFGLFEQDRAHLAGSFPELEAQLCSWVPGTGKSPDRLDALVHGAHALITLDTTMSISVPHGRRPDAGAGGPQGQHWNNLKAMLAGALR